MKKRSIFMALIAAMYSATLCAQPVIQPPSPPPELKRYETQLFNLLDRTERAAFDPDLSNAYKSLLQKAPVTDSKLAKKLLSGPAPKGRYIVLERVPYFYYTACQAHWCSTTNLAMLFSPATKQSFGVLYYKCATHYLNISNDSQKSWLDSLNPRQLDQAAQKQLCDEARNSKS